MSEFKVFGTYTIRVEVVSHKTGDILDECEVVCRDADLDEVLAVYNRAESVVRSAPNIDDGWGDDGEEDEDD